MGPSVHGLKEFSGGPFHKTHFPGSRLKPQWNCVEDTWMLLELKLEEAVRETVSMAVDIVPSKNSIGPGEVQVHSPPLQWTRAAGS